MIILPMNSSNECPAIVINKDQLWKKFKGTYKNKRAIYVEDQISNQEILSPLLNYLGFKTICTGSGEEALGYLEINGPQSCSLIITDLRMPQMSGQTLVMEIRKLERKRKASKIPIIVLTGEPSENEKSICLNILGVDEYLSKPASFNRLTESIHSVFDMAIINKRKQSKVHRDLKGILIVDDDQLCSFLTKQFLSGMNILIHQAFTLKTVY